MTYGDGPQDGDMGLSDVDKGLVMYTDLNIFGVQVMFSDTPSGMPFIAGNNISLTLVTDDEAEIRRLFGELSEGGEVDMELQPTFWAHLYGMLTDKFGISWMLSHNSEAMGG